MLARTRPSLLLLLALGLVVVLAACSAGSLTVSDIESKLRKEIPEKTADIGIEVTDVICPEDASVEAGATFECDVPAIENGQDVVYTATITVESESSASWELTDVRLADPG